MEASFSAFLLLFCALFSSQTVALKDGPTIGFISPDVVSDIGKQKSTLQKAQSTHCAKSPCFGKKIICTGCPNMSNVTFWSSEKFASEASYFYKILTQ